MGVDLRVGDVVRVSCPFTEMPVTRVEHHSVAVRWPWWRPDPECDWGEWDGDLGLAIEGHHEWRHELFRTEPAAGLRVGDTCRVGIPPTVVHVIAVHHFDPPQRRVYLPRSSREVVVRRIGQAHEPGMESEDTGFDPDDDVPLSFEVLFRPYAWLEIGDELADAAGRVWRFDTPWHWHAFDGERHRTPAWPLTLLTRGGRFDPDEAAAALVARATGSGSPAAELARWQGLTRANPPGAVAS